MKLNTIKKKDSQSTAILINGQKYESITKAATMLGCSHATLSERVRRLRKSRLSELETDIFIMTTVLIKEVKDEAIL